MDLGQLRVSYPLENTEQLALYQVKKGLRGKQAQKVSVVPVFIVNLFVIFIFVPISIVLFIILIG